MPDAKRRSGNKPKSVHAGIKEMRERERTTRMTDVDGGDLKFVVYWALKIIFLALVTF